MTDGTVHSLDALEARLAEMANAQFDSPQYRKILSLPLTQERAQIYILQRSYFHLNRRDCWAYVQAAAPFDIKQMIWDHEREELEGDKKRGIPDHYTLGMQEGGAVGLTTDDFGRTSPLDGTMACCAAWIHLAKDRPWLEALPVCAVTEISNSDEICKGGGFARRMARKMTNELGIPLKKQHSNAEHVVLDVEHAHLLMRAARLHASTEKDFEMILKGAAESLRVERIFKGVLGDAIGALPGPE
ncbi:iron-containing redox enzyme family protein [Alphaproteobacteria bacterium]|nr:iron-containing redox enzyme family protein [Alphaproteobacteria bacterium]